MMQQKASVLPHFLQTCVTTLCLPLPSPTTVNFCSQTGHVSSRVVVAVLMWPFSVLMWVTVIVLHLGQAIATISPSLRFATSAGEVIGFIIIISPPFIGFMGSSARAARGSEGVIAKANAAPMPSMILDVVLVVFIFESFVYSTCFAICSESLL
jgi:hypothetical protein